MDVPNPTGGEPDSGAGGGPQGMTKAPPIETWDSGRWMMLKGDSFQTPEY